MPPTKVGIREFRENLSSYLESKTPVAITRHGATISDCRFCQSSAPFHRALAARARSDIHIIAAFDGGSDSVESGKKYLAAHGIAVLDVRAVSLGAVRVRGTPTLELVDRGGKVVRSWAGELDIAGQNEVAAFVEADSWWKRSTRVLSSLLASK